MDEIAVRNWNDRVLFMLILAVAIQGLACIQLISYQHIVRVRRSIGLIAVGILLIVAVWCYFTFVAFARLS